MVLICNIKQYTQLFKEIELYQILVIKKLAFNDYAGNVRLVFNSGWFTNAL